MQLHHSVGDGVGTRCETGKAQQAVAHEPKAGGLRAAVGASVCSQSRNVCFEAHLRASAIDNREAAVCAASVLGVAL